jgi:uncharacterized membrane protein
VFFTDAVAAIALTLLILPLLETVAEAPGEVPFHEFMHEHAGQFGAFLLSFAVIFRFWWAHHRLFRHVETIRGRLVLLSAFWTFAIVLLPIPTALITAYEPSAGTVGLYGGTLALSSGSMTLIALYIYRHPEVSTGRTRATREEVLGNLTIFATQLLATAVGAVFYESVNYWAFLLMFLTGPVEAVVKSRWRRHEVVR